MSNQNESGKLNGQDEIASEHDSTASGDGACEATAQASQTLPLITEELVATHSPNTESAPPASRHVTTPVLPPNPVRRDEAPKSATQMLRENTTAGTPATDAGRPPMKASTPATDVNGTAATDVKGTADPGGSTAENEVVEKKEKSENRVSATQLVAGAAAAATSSVIGGQLGVAGTVVGAGVASIITGLAVTLYTSSLDKGREKIKKVGTKLAPAVKAKTLGAKAQGSSAVTAAQAAEPSRVTVAFGSLSDEADAAAGDVTSSGDTTSSGGAEAAAEEPKSWTQKLRRKRVLYPVTIGVATFGIGLGAVVMAESFTDADLSPGTSQISRSVTGQSGVGDDSGTSQDGGGTAESGSSGADSQPGQNPNQGSGNEDSTTSEGQSTSANEGDSTSSSTADQTETSQGSDANSSATTSTDAAGTGSESSSAGTDASSEGAASSGAGSSSGAQGRAGSSGSGSSSSSGGSGDGAGSGSGSSSAGSGGTAGADG